MVEPVVAWVDAAKVERVVENLLANASRHTTPDTSVWVRVARRDEGVLLAVEDAGGGVPRELRATLFEPFRQGPGVSPTPPGSASACRWWPASPSSTAAGRGCRTGPAAARRSRSCSRIRPARPAAAPGGGRRPVVGRAGARRPGTPPRSGGPPPGPGTGWRPPAAPGRPGPGPGAGRSAGAGPGPQVAADQLAHPVDPRAGQVGHQAGRVAESQLDQAVRHLAGVDRLEPEARPPPGSPAAWPAAAPSAGTGVWNWVARNVVQGRPEPATPARRPAWMRSSRTSPGPGHWSPGPGRPRRPR